MIGHRGTRTLLDENTIAAFHKAIESGAEYIEFDVRTTSDEKLIILHDSTLERTTNGFGKARNRSYDELETLQTARTNQKIPLLSDMLEKFRGKAKFMIELKERGIWKGVVNLLTVKDCLQDAVISGRSFKELKEVKRAIPGIKTCYNITKGDGLSLETFLQNGFRENEEFKPDMISLRSTSISNRFIERCHENEIHALAWDFLEIDDPLKAIKDLILRSVDGILFDDHQNLLAIKEWLD